MPNLSLIFDLVGRDVSASKTFRDVGDSADKAGKSGENFGTRVSSGLKLAAGALLGAGLIEGFKSLYEAAAESARIGRLTENVIRSTGGAAGISAKQVGDLATAISKKTGVDDEAIQSGANLLLTFTNVRNEVGKGNDIFNQATGIITDMSVALGQDTSSSAIQLGKALNDPIKGVTALQRVGVSFTESQKEQIATLVESGHTMDAQRLILGELSKEFGGAAAAASTPFDKLKVTLGNLAEEVGSNLIPYVDKAANFLMDDLLPAAGRVGDTVGDVLGPALHVAGEALGFIYNTGKGAVDLFKDLPGPVQATLIAMGGLAVLKGPIGSLFEGLSTLAGRAAIGIINTAGAVSSLGGAGGVAKAGLGGLVSFLGGPWGLALTGAVLGLSLLVSWLGDTDDATAGATQAQQGLADALRQSKGAIDENVRASAAKLAQDQGLLDAADAAGISLDQVTGAILGQGNAYNEVMTGLVAYRDAHTGLNGERTKEAQLVAAAIPQLQQLSGTTDASVTSADQLTRATGEASTGMTAASGTAQQLMTDLQDTADAAGEAKTQTDLFRQSLDILTGAHISLAEAQSSMYDALAAATGALENEGGAVLDATGAIDLHSEAGRKAQDVLFGVRDAGNQYIATLIQQGATLGEATAADAELRKSFIASAGQMGITGVAAETLADQILGVPDQRLTTFTADTKQATDAAAELQRQIDAIHGRTVDIIARSILPDLNGSVSGSGRFGTLAFGGPVLGSSPHDRADNVPIWATAGEFMQPVPSVRKYGMGFMEDVRTGRFPMELAHGYADGGPIGSAPISIQAELDNRSVNNQLDAFARQVIDAYEPVHGYVNALKWAMSQSGKPYIWGGVGPGGYDCSGFMSAITNVIRGRSPYSRVGSTANFPWGGFAGGNGMFTIGSTPNAGGGIGHMAGTLLGTNVESTGDHVRYGSSARGASNGLFRTRAHLAMAGGGVIGEPVSGVGMYSGRSYSFGERGPETVTPGLPGGGDAVFHLYDTDGVLIGSIRGHAEAAATSALTSVLDRGAHNP